MSGAEHDEPMHATLFYRDFLFRDGHYVLKNDYHTPFAEGRINAHCLQAARGGSKSFFLRVFILIES
jgi:hypothetical protein